MKAVIYSTKLFFLIIITTVGFAQPVANFDYSIGADGLSVNFTNQSTGNIIAYKWTFGNGASSDKINPFYKYDKENEYNVCLEVTDDKYKTNYTCKVLNIKAIGQTCTAGFNFVKDAEGFGVQFNNTSSPNTNVEFNWNFGDNTTSNKVSPYHVFPKVGEYVVCLQMHDLTTGCKTDFCSTLFVDGGTQQNCYAKFSFVKNDLAFNFNNESFPMDAKTNWSFL